MFYSMQNGNKNADVDAKESKGTQPATNLGIRECVGQPAAVALFLVMPSLLSNATIARVKIVAYHRPIFLRRTTRRYVLEHYNYDLRGRVTLCRIQFPSALAICPPRHIHVVSASHLIDGCAAC
jgi:hypothetical protein